MFRRPTLISTGPRIRNEIPESLATMRALCAASSILRVSKPVTVVMLPAFFALTGLRTEIGLLSTMSDWLICALIVLVATGGKFGGTTLAGRASGLTWRQAAGLGVLMNTRGLMELIVLNIGLDLGVISPTLFTMLVLMALVTTIATTPALTYVLRTQKR